MPILKNDKLFVNLNSITKNLFIMKKSFLLLFVLTTISSFAQTDYSKVVMASDADYKAAEKSALEASNYLLSTPLDTKNMKLEEATKFLSKWMEGTPDYTYIIESPVISKLNAENAGLTGVYFAAMTKFSLENPAKAQDPQLVMITGIKTLLAYAEKPENKVVMADTVKKLIELNKNGELEKLFK